MRTALPQLGETLRVGGLDAPVEIFRDPLGIPHVRAQTTHDAFFGQGFVHAQDRLWQMEYDRRRAAGRLAECIGTPARLTMDVFCRRMGIAATAHADHESFDDETRAVLEAYAAGVNAFLSTDPPLPYEFQLLGITIEPWEPWDCGSVLKVRHVLMGTFDYKLWRARLMRALGPHGAVVPGSPHMRDDLLILPVGEREVWTAQDDYAEPAALASATLAEGSNNWAIHGSRTASGAPLVAGDPHRTLEVPNVYYQNHVACPSFDAIGLSMAGVPGMFHFGHNAHVAWCVTHAMADTQDLFVERFDDRGRYEFEGEWLPSERRTEVVGVRDADDVDIDVTITHHGPVIFGDPSTGSAITFRWTGTDRPNTSLKTILPTLRARSVDELDEVMRDWVDPCNNFVMADVHGTIAYLYRGRVPARSRANAWVPVPGWTGTHEWDGDVPYEELPRLRNPETGYIVTANNRVVSGDYPHFLGMDYGPPFRATRLLERVSALEQATAEDMASIHADRVSIAAPLFVEAAADLDGLTGAVAEARDLLGAWDRKMDPDSVGATIYAAVRDRLAAVLIERQPLASAVPNPFPEEPLPTPAHTRTRVAVARLLAAGDRSLLDGADWEDLVHEALDRAVAYLENRLGPDMSQWRWERSHRTQIVHPVSRVFPDRSGDLDPPVVSQGGDGECVQAGSAEIGLRIVSSSVARYVFDLGDWDRSAWIVPLGSSGHPASPHYADQAEDWARVELHPMLYSWDRIEAGAETTQRLEPQRDGPR